MFIVSVTYKAGLDVIDALLPAHVEFLKTNMAAGNFLLSGRKIPRTGGVILADMDAEEELWALLRQDPFFVHGAADYALTRFAPSLARHELAFLKEY